MTPIILAAADVPNEPELVAAAASAGITIMRRAVDAPDLLAAAAADRSVAVVVTLGMPRLTGDLVRRLLADDRRVIGLIGSPEDRQRLHAWGVIDLVELHADAQATMRALAIALDRGDDGVWSMLATEPDRAVGGVVIAVWGPSGAPGRTTSTIAIGEAFAATGARTCIVDADLGAPAMIAQLGIVDDTSGLVVACRHADNGTLTARSVVGCTRTLVPGLAVLGGLPRADRWADVRESAARAVWDALRVAFDVVVIDVGSTLCELDDEPLGSTMLAVRRGVIASTAIEAADRVLVTARGSTLGLVRLLTELPMLTRAPHAVLLTGEHAEGDGVGVLRAAGIDAPVIRLPRSSRGLEQAVRVGALPRESASRRERRQLDRVLDALRAEPGAATAKAGRRRGRRL